MQEHALYAVVVAIGDMQGEGGVDRTKKVVTAPGNSIDLFVGDSASQRHATTPPLLNSAGLPLFPATEWWLTDIERRKQETQQTGCDNDTQQDEDPDAVEQAYPVPSSSDPDSDSDRASTSNSAASLPAGPDPKRRRGRHPSVPWAASSAVPAAMGPAVAASTRRLATLRNVCPISSELSVLHGASTSSSKLSITISGAQARRNTLFPFDGSAELCEPERIEGQCGFESRAPR